MMYYEMKSNRLLEESNTASIIEPSIMGKASPSAVTGTSQLVWSWIKCPDLNDTKFLGAIITRSLLSGFKFWSDAPTHIIITQKI